MKIPAKVHYAIIVMTDIALQGEGITATGNDIARRQNISFAFVAQLLNKLKHAGLLQSIRGGSGGGYQLTNPPSEITLKNIIDIIEPTFCICPSQEIKTTQVIDEVVRSVWYEIEANIERIFETTTLEEMATRVKKSSRKGGDVRER